MKQMRYQPDAHFESLKPALFAGVDLRRLRIFHICVHLRVEREDILDPVASAVEYASFLQLSTDEVPYFSPVGRISAERLCLNIAEFTLAHGSQQMLHSTAATLAAAWMEQFDQKAIFLTNCLTALKSPPDVNDARSLFHTDLEAGVIAVSPAKVGLFWSAENS